MNRAFTTREKVLLVILAVLIIGIGYFKLLLEPINTSIENYRNMTASEQDEILVNTALLQKKKQMETELEELFASGDPTPIPVYDNSGNLLVELHRILDKSLDKQEMNDLFDNLFACQHPNYTADGKIIIHILKNEDVTQWFK